MSESEIGTLAGKLFSDAAGHFITVAEDSADAVKFSAQGGGFLRTMPREGFFKVFTPSQLPPFKAAKFGADWLPENFPLEGFTNGQRWNGWAMPYFTKETGLRLMAEMPGLKFDEEANAFTSEDENLDDEESLVTFPAETLDVDRVAVTVYAIGAGSWCWDRG
jgi:hypothetical protein